MKQVPQNEIDVLLRKLGQDQVGATEVKSAHLDPDELSAYAENALPQAARDKYTEHLVDCNACRRIVTDLTPWTVLESKKEEAPVSAVHQFFSRLITPSFLRYAVPSLAAVLILAIGFFVVNRQQFRTSQRVREMVAKNESQPSVETRETAAPPAAGVSSVQNRVSSVQDNKPASPSDKKTAKTNTDESQPDSSTPAMTAEDQVRGRVEAEKRAEVDRIEVSRNAAAKAPPPPNAPEPTVGGQADVAKSKVTETKQEPVAEVRTMKEEARKLDDTQAVASTPKPQAAPQTRRAGMPAAAAGAASESAGRDKQKKDNDQSNYKSETRRVSGRDFLRVKGVWTDTAYDGRETTNLSRGSEQFRALVADEPSLRTIADQLDGQIVVVWKGRAYRIR